MAGTPTDTNMGAVLLEKNDKKFQKDFWKNYVKSQSETLHKNKNYDREI